MITAGEKGVVKPGLSTSNSYSRRMRMAFLQTSPLQEEFLNKVLEAMPPLTQKSGLRDLSADASLQLPPLRMKEFPAYYSGQD